MHRENYLIFVLIWTMLGGSPPDATVQVKQRGTGTGSGTVIRLTADGHAHDVIITAAHVVSASDDCEIVRLHSRHPARVLSRDHVGDVAIVAGIDGFEWPHVISRNTRDLPASGARLVTWGYPSTRPNGPWKIETEIVGNRRYVDGSIATRYAVDAGHSGGGLFLGDELISVCSARSPSDNTSVFAPIAAVQNILDRSRGLICRGGT